MNRFFILEIGSLTQYKYAWAEVVDQNVAVSPPQCPKCKRAIGMLPWLPPYNAWLKQPQNIGDFVSCFGGATFLGSERFLKALQKYKLKGVERSYPIQIVKIGSRGKSPQEEIPKLFGIDIQHTLCRVDYNSSKVKWTEPPKPNYCSICGPGGGAEGGILKSISKIVLEPNTWSGEDFFIPINLSGTICLSENAKEIINKYEFTNCNVIPLEEWNLTFGP